MLSVGSQLPEYRIRAFNSATDSNNLIHDDNYARRYGYRGGLVPGVSIYAYMSRSLVELLGREWLERGSAAVRFDRPTYEGEEVRVSGKLASIAEDGTLTIEFQAANAVGLVCAGGTAGLTRAPAAPGPKLKDYPAGHGKLGRPIALESLKVGERLTPVTSEFSWNVNWEYCQKTVRDHHPIYNQIAHPGWLLTQANSVFAANYELPPWIHVSSVVQNYRLQELEGLVETRGCVREKFERKGHHFVVLDLAIFAGKECLATIGHTAIFHIAPRAA